MSGLQIISAILLAVTACQSAPSAPEPEASVDYCRRADSIRVAFPAPQGSWTTDHEFALAALTVPGGFGGFYRAIPGGQFVVLLVDTAQASAAKTALATTVTCGALFQGYGIQPVEFTLASIHPGRYDAYELLVARHSVGAWIFSQGACAFGISTARNALWVLVPDSVTAEQIASAAAGRGVPPSLLAIEVGTCPTPA